MEGSTPAEFGRNSDQKYTDITGEVQKNVIVISGDNNNKLYSLPALSWVSHMPEPPLFVRENEIPQATKDALKKRNAKANIYIIGPEKVVSKQVEDQLKQYGKVTRISGDTPVANSIAFAVYKDKETGFGWGITEPGHGLALVSTSTPNLALVAGPFAHKGKHAPMILLDNGQLTKELYSFLAKIKPTFEKDPTTGPYNHAYLIGNFNKISFQTQGILDERLEIVKVGEMEH